MAGTSEASRHTAWSRFTTGATLVICVLVLTAGCAGGALASPVTRTKPVAGAGLGFTPGEDWTHVLQVVANLKAAPPSGPLILLLGDSTARECTVSDAVWATQIQESGGPPATAYNLASSNRSFAQDIALVRELPRVPAVVLIGISLGPFTSSETTATVQLPSPTAILPPYDQHLYGESSVLSDTEKARLVGEWLRKRYPLFEDRFGSCARVLSQLVRVCRCRGFTPVLVETPLNLAVIGHRFDRPVGRYRRACRALAERRHIPYLRFLTRAGLTSPDFADLWHLVDTGRARCQGLLSPRSAALLAALDGGAGL